MALVICCVFLTERIRRRMSIRLGMCGYGWLFRREPALELLEDGGQLVSQFVVKRFLFANLGQRGAMRIVHEPVQFLLEFAAPLYGQIIQVGVGAGEDDEDLLFDR